MRFTLAFVLIFLSGPAIGQGVALYEYRALSDLLNARSDFETLPQRPEPGFNLDALYRSTGLWIGERLRGQETGTRGAHDQLLGRPTAPLRALPGKPARNLSVAFHKGFGSNALFPLGNAGFPSIEARGEGAISVVFDTDQFGFGLRVHSDYSDPLGVRSGAAGQVDLRIYDRSGVQIAHHILALETGINEFGFLRAKYRQDIAGFTLENTDPGGIALDDIIFDLRALSG